MLPCVHLAVVQESYTRLSTSARRASVWLSDFDPRDAKATITLSIPPVVERVTGERG